MALSPQCLSIYYQSKWRLLKNSKFNLIDSNNVKVRNRIYLSSSVSRLITDLNERILQSISCFLMKKNGEKVSDWLFIRDIGNERHHYDTKWNENVRSSQPWIRTHLFKVELWQWSIIILLQRRIVAQADQWLSSPIRLFSSSQHVRLISVDHLPLADC